MLKLLFIFFLALCGCAASSNQSTTEQLIPALELSTLGLDLNDSIVISEPGIDIRFIRVSKDFYQVKQTVSNPTPYFRKQKIIYNIDNNINSGNKDKSKFEITDKSKDKSRENSGNKHKSKDKSKENSGNKTKEKGGLPWWLWLIIILVILITVFYKKIKAWIPLPWRAILPCSLILLIYSGCAVGYDPALYPIGEKFNFYYPDSTLGEGYIFRHHPFYIEMADDTTDIEDANLGIIRPKFLIRPINASR